MEKEGTEINVKIGIYVYYKISRINSMDVMSLVMLIL
jgi:hypothetical protein